MNAVRRKIQGLLSPSSWGDNGEVIDTKVLTFDEQEFLIERTSSQDGLDHYLRKFIEITGDIDFKTKKINSVDKVVFINPKKWRK